MEDARYVMTGLEVSEGVRGGGQTGPIGNEYTCLKRGRRWGRMGGERKGGDWGGRR